LQVFRKERPGEPLMRPDVVPPHCRVPTGRNRDDGRGHFAGFWPRQQRIGTRRSLTCSRRCTFSPPGVRDVELVIAWAIGTVVISAFACLSFGLWWLWDRRRKRRNGAP
jgi:hypothetical protein